MRPTFRYFLFLAVLIGLATGIELMSGRILVWIHFGDVLHAIEASSRIVDGELPHVNFMTPIGILGFAPVALFLSWGMAPGMSLVLANTLVALAVLPMLAWAGLSRLEGAARWVFGGVIILFLMAFSYGGVEVGPSFSMNYNRWAWAITFVVLLVVVWPPRDGTVRPWRDALVIGGGLSALALLKMTYFLAFGGAALLLLLIDRRFRVIVYVAVVGAVVAGGVTVLFGFGYWFAYAGDLLQVALYSPRPYPFRTLPNSLIAPDRIFGTLTYVAAIILLRVTGYKREGLAVLVLAPAFAYVVYQNWGNDQKWLIFLGFLLYGFRAATGAEKIFGKLDARDTGRVLTLAAAVLSLPFLFTMLTSIFGVANFSGRTARQIPFSSLSRDIWLPAGDTTTRGYFVSDVVSPLAWTSPDAVTKQSFQGVDLPSCTLREGFVTDAQSAIDLVRQTPGTAGSPVAIADAVNFLWLLSDIPRVPDAAPWYYGGDRGYENAGYYLVPLCPKLEPMRGESLKAMAGTGWGFDLVGRNDNYILYKITR